jgi:hypothetical protein
MSALPSLRVRIELKPQDLWIGAFWRTEQAEYGSTVTHLWICLLPCIPIHLWWYRKARP